MLSIGLYLYIQVFTVSVNPDSIFKKKKIFLPFQQCFLWNFVYCVWASVCILFWSADVFSESTYSGFKSSQRLPRLSPQQLLNVHKLLFAWPNMNCVNKWLSQGPCWIFKHYYLCSSCSFASIFDCCHFNKYLLSLLRFFFFLFSRW